MGLLMFAAVLDNVEYTTCLCTTDLHRQTL